MVATWKTQAAPTFDAALKAAQEANDSMASGRERMSDAAGGVITDTEENLTNRAKSELMNLDTDQAREEYLTENPSSFYDTDKIQAFRKELLETDEKRQDEKDHLSILSQTQELSALDGQPLLQAQALGDMQKFNKYNGIKDKENMLASRSDDLLNNTEFQVTDQTIRDAGGDPNNEDSLDADVQERAFALIDKKIRKDFFGADEATIEKKRNDAFAASKYGAMFARRTKTQAALSSEDVRIREQAKAMSRALFAEDSKGLIAAVDTASKYIMDNPKLKPEQLKYLEVPIMKALQGMKINGELVNAQTEWDRINGEGADGSVANQNRFGREMAKLYQQKFKLLPKEVINKQIASLISNSDNLKTMIGVGNLQAKFQVELDTEYLEAIKGVKTENLNILKDMRTSSPAATTRRALEKKLIESLEKTDFKMQPGDRIKLIKNVHQTIAKAKSAFMNRDGELQLTAAQEATLDLGLYRLLTNTVGFDPDDGLIPASWDSPDFVFSHLNMKDIKNVSIPTILEALKEFLPPVKDRTKGTREKDAVLLEKVIKNNKYMQGYTPPTKKVKKQNVDEQGKPENTDMPISP
jgi:hypothetical protein